MGLCLPLSKTLYIYQSYEKIHKYNAILVDAPNVAEQKTHTSINCRIRQAIIVLGIIIVVLSIMIVILCNK